MYDIFLDAVSQKGRISVSHNGIWTDYFLDALLGNESQKLPHIFLGLLEKNGIYPRDIQNIYVVHGPGSFTGIRTICLIVNTLAYVFPHISLIPVSFFDLFSLYPIVKQSSKRDLFVQTKKGAIIDILQFQECYDRFPGVLHYYGSGDDFRKFLGEKGCFLEESYDTGAFFESFQGEKHTHISPLYIKKPNIT